MRQIGSLQTLLKRFKTSTFSSERPSSFFQPILSPSEGLCHLQRCLTTSGDAFDFEHPAQGNLQGNAADVTPKFGV